MYYYLEQHDLKDCGAACLAMICGNYGHKAPMQKFRTLTKTDNNGTTVYNLCCAANELGLKTETLTGTSEELLTLVRDKAIKVPFIAHVMKDNALHFVVVYKMTNKSVTLADPGEGLHKCSLEDFSSSWTGIIITFEKTESFAKVNEKNFVKNFFFPYLIKNQKLISILFITSLTIAGIGLFGGFSFQILLGVMSEENVVNVDEMHTHTNSIDDLTVDIVNQFNGITGIESKNILDVICVFFIMLYIVQALIQYLRGLLLSKLSQKIDFDILERYISQVLSLPMNFFNNRKTGEILSRFEDSYHIRDAITNATISVLLDFFMVIAGGIVLIQISLRLFLMTAVLLCLYCFIVMYFYPKIQNINRRIMEQNAFITSYFKESVDGIETLKLYGFGRQVKDKATNIVKKMTISKYNGAIVTLKQAIFTDFISSVGIIFILWMGLKELSSGNISIGSLLTFGVLVGYFTEPIKNLMSLQSTLQSAEVAAERLSDILYEEKEDMKESLFSDEGIFEKEIKFSNVFFSYIENIPVIKNVSMNIPYGTVNAIVGNSGSGKTTLVRLLLDLYNFDEGDIYIGDQNIKNISMRVLRENIVYLPQNVFFFSDTIINNLLLGNQYRDQYSRDEIKDVCKKCRIDDFIEELPLGYDTFLEENGENLSNGQRQRLAIARALLKRPKVLIFDESTSNLDATTERAIMDMITADMDITIIIIAHRLSTIKNCKKIYVMQNGEIIDSGSHNDLLKNCDSYRGFFESSLY